MPPAACRYTPSCPGSNAVWKSFPGDSLQQAQPSCLMFCSPVEAPSARAFAMCPTVWIPPSAITGTPNLLAYSDTLYTAVAWGRPHASTTGGREQRKGQLPRNSTSPPQQALQASSTHAPALGNPQIPGCSFPRELQEKRTPRRCLLGHPHGPRLQKAVWVTLGLGSLNAWDQPRLAARPGAQQTRGKPGKEVEQTPKAPLQSIPPLAPS